MSATSGPIVIEAPRLLGGRIEARVSGGAASKYLRARTSWVDYGTAVGLGGVPPAQLMIPIVGAVLPLAVATGTEIVVPYIDGVFAAACDELAIALGRLYPSFRPEAFRLIGERVQLSEPAGGGEGAVLLFSGGVDSTSSLIEHRDEVRELVMVWGADIPSGETDLWGRHVSFVTAAPLVAGRVLVQARTNVGDLLDSLRLNRRYERDFTHGTWWGAAQHGITLTTLTAPIAIARQRPRSYIASSHSFDSAMPWGSMPDIDNRVRWTGGRAVHDQYHLTRQMKLAQLLAPYVADGGRANLAVCYQTFRDFVGVNCGTCEKCLRTLAGIASTGTDPARLGLPVAPSALARARSALTSGEWYVNPPERTRWTGIQDGMLAEPHLAGLSPELRDFLTWLRGTPLPPVPATAPTPDGIQRRFVLEATYWGERAGRHLPLPLRKAIRARLIPRSARAARPG